MKELPEELQAKITAYIDGDLPADQAAALEVYLANTDPRLSEMVIGMMADRHGISVLPKISAPQDLTARVMDQLERNSLLHGVEEDLTRPHRAWWTSRSAIAAALTIVLGGFTYFVVHSVYRPNGTIDHLANSPIAAAGRDSADKTVESRKDSRVPAGPAASTGERDRRVADAVQPGGFGFGGGAVGGRAMKTGPAPADTGIVRTDTAPFTPADSTDALNMALAKSKDNATPRSLILDMENPSEERIMRDREVLQSGDLAAATRKGYAAVPSAQQALADVHAAPENVVDGPPVVLYCQAQNSQDPARLQRQLAAFMDNPQNAQVNLIRTSQYSPNGLTLNGGTWTLSGANNYSGGTTVAKGTLNVTTNGGAAFSGALNNDGLQKETTTVNTGGVLGNTAAAIGTGSSTNGVTAGSGAGGLTKVQNGAVTIAGITSGGATVDNNRPNFENNTIDLNGKMANSYSGTTTINSGTLKVGGNSTYNNDGNNTTNFDANDLKFMQQGGGEAPRNYRVYNVNSYGRQNKIVEQQSKQRNDDSDTFVGAPGTPYRVYLRPEQLNQLTTEFRVLSVKRGQANYVIPPADGANRSESHAAKSGEKHLQEDYDQTAADPAHGSEAAGAAIPAEAAMPSPVAGASPATAPARGQVTKASAKGPAGAEGKSSAEGEAQDRPAAINAPDAVGGDAAKKTEYYMSRAAETAQIKSGAARQKAEAPASADGRWIEVIIAMDPPPAPNAALTPNAKPDSNPTMQK